MRDPVEVVQDEGHLGHAHKIRLASMTTPPKPLGMDWKNRNYRWPAVLSAYELGSWTKGMREAECEVATAFHPSEDSKALLAELRAEQLVEKEEAGGMDPRIQEPVGFH